MSAPVPPPRRSRLHRWIIGFLIVLLAVCVLRCFDPTLSPGQRVDAIASAPIAIGISLLVGAAAKALARKSGRGEAAFDIASRITIGLFILVMLVRLVQIFTSPKPPTNPSQPAQQQTQPLNQQ